MISTMEEHVIPDVHDIPQHKLMERKPNDKLIMFFFWMSILYNRETQYSVAKISNKLIDHSVRSQQQTNKQKS